MQSQRSSVAVTLWLLAGCGVSDAETARDEPGLYLNEFVASNGSGLQDESGAFPDWIELCNRTDATIDLTDWTLTDDALTPAKWSFADATTIESRRYLVIFADGDVLQGPLHASFSLDAELGDLGLYDPDGVSVDELTYGTQTRDVSHARLPDGAEDWGADDSPTPGETNQ